MAVSSLNEIVKRVRDLPSLPAVVMDLMTCIDQESAGTKLLADKLSRDQALAAKTLRLANSSYYGMARKVSSISQAIAVLGFNSVRTMVSAVAVAGIFPGGSLGRFDFEVFWRHSIASAVCSKALAKRLRQDGEQAFIAGLLHDIGRLVLVVQFPREYNEVLKYHTEHKCHLQQAEVALLHVDHSTVGKALAEHWKFPPLIQNSIANHHNADWEQAGSLATIVQIANSMVFDMVHMEGEDDLGADLPAAALEAMGITEPLLEEVREEAHQQFEEVCRVLMNNI